MLSVLPTCTRILASIAGRPGRLPGASLQTAGAGRQPAAQANSRLGPQVPHHGLAQSGLCAAAFAGLAISLPPTIPLQVTVALSTEELARRKKVLARAALAGRSFSSPHGELDAHRLCRALEKVSQKRNQSLEGQLDKLGPRARQLQPSAVESSACWLLGDEGGGDGAGCPRITETTSCRCPDNLLSPTHLDWDMLVEPSYLFSASPVPEPGEPSLGDASLPLRCQVVIHALRAGKPVSWEVTASLEPLLQPREGPGRDDPPRRTGKVWDKPLHRLAARSVIRDNENAAQREAELEQGGCHCVCPSAAPVQPQHLPHPSPLTAPLPAGFARRFRLKAMQTSKACNVPSLYTRLVPVDGAMQAALPAAPEVWGTGTVGGGHPACWGGDSEGTEG